MDMLRSRLTCRQGEYLEYGQSRWPWGVRGRSLALVLVVGLWGLVLTGCDDAGDVLADLFRFNDNAEAQDENETRVETVVITPDEFVFTTDIAPDITIIDGTTRYDLRADTTLDFDNFGIRALESGDILIERPGINSSVVTLIRQIQ
ncbi:hypothetical protein NKDENANG_01634 [Candidatus Entotheonellaceae bacterium PAL068K]